jgi:tetratricopeptide (TPR) repeat protein
MSDRLGNSDLAKDRYEAALRYLSDSQAEAKVGAIQALAVLLLEKRKPKAAKGVLDQLDDSDILSAGALASAKVLLARAELASQLAQARRAESLFDEAAKALKGLEAISDQAAVTLLEVRHHLRHGQSDMVAGKARALIELGHDRRLDTMGRALLIEAARLCLRGHMDFVRVGSTIKKWHGRSTSDRSKVAQPPQPKGSI